MVALQTDDDVLQLEQLREIHRDEKNHFSHQKKDELVADDIASYQADETLPELEQQLESAKPDVQSTQGPAAVAVESVGETPEVPPTEVKGSGAHRPPTLQNNDGGKIENNGEKPKAKVSLHIRNC